MASESDPNSRWQVCCAIREAARLDRGVGGWRGQLSRRQSRAPMTQVNGTNELMTQIHDA